MVCSLLPFDSVPDSWNCKEMRTQSLVTVAHRSSLQTSILSQPLGLGFTMAEDPDKREERKRQSKTTKMVVVRKNNRADEQTTIREREPTH